MFKVLVYDADSFSWSVMGSYRREADARSRYHDLRITREWQWTALVLVRGLSVEVLATDAPNAGNLHLVSSFYTPATFHR